MEKVFAHFRKVSIIAVVASVLGSFLMFLIGAVKVFRAYQSYFPGELTIDTGPMRGANLSIAYLVQAVDAFLIALILMIFGSGVFNLFVRSDSADGQRSSKLFQIHSIAELKRILAEMIVIILMVKFLESALINMEGFRWEALVLPGAILLLAAAVRVLKLDH